MNAYVLDTSAILNFFRGDGELYVPFKVWKELQKYRNEIGEIQYTYYEIHLKVREPSDEYKEKVIAKAKKTGDIYRLSKADIDVIALALELKGIVVSNDLSIQNVCETLGIRYMEFGGKKIKEVVKWRLRCIDCGRYFDEFYEYCPICGGRLKPVRDKRKGDMRD